MSDDLDELLASIQESPEYRALERRQRIARALTGWMVHLPLGRLVHRFWFNLLTDGLTDTIKPRWGALTFSFLNDGYGATPWHTWRSIHHDNSCEFTCLYPEGAPSSLVEAYDRAHPATGDPATEDHRNREGQWP